MMAPAAVHAELYCRATQPDLLGPFYEPGAPTRSVVGEGYTLSGVVRSLEDCRPLPGARIEIWMAGPDGVYGDAWRATVFADDEGRYTFHSHPPVPYMGRPAHIHLRVTAPGHATLITQHYSRAWESAARMELTLTPQ